jgi:hypothetical protein
MHLRITNLRIFLIKNDCFTSILFFTFVPMNNNQNTKKFSSKRNRNNRSFLSLLKRFYGIKGNFSFDVFQYFKADYDKLQIIYANIRV